MGVDLGYSTYSNSPLFLDKSFYNNNFSYLNNKQTLKNYNVKRFNNEKMNNNNNNKNNNIQTYNTNKLTQINNNKNKNNDILTYNTNKLTQINNNNNNNKITNINSNPTNYIIRDFNATNNNNPYNNETTTKSYKFKINSSINTDKNHQIIDVSSNKQLTLYKNKIINNQLITTSTNGNNILSVSNFSLNEHLIIPVNISFNGITIYTHAMIDSGATGSFIDDSFIQNHKIPIVKKLIPIELNVIDGRPISSGKITHNTIKLQMYYSNHCENIILDITSLGKYPIILGIPWLKQHNPYIDWPTHYINFKQSNCTNYCINTKLDIHEKSDEILAILNPSYNIFSTNTDLQDNNHIIQLPDKYKEYKDVFSKEEADKLPPYRNYDHKINLLPNTNPPFGPIYSLSEPELKALCEYLDENLAKDFIQLSTSPRYTFRIDLEPDLFETLYI